MIGSQSGSVMSVTSTSPGSMRFISLISWITFTGPAPMRWPMARPFGDDLPLSVEGITLHHLAAGTHGFRTRLNDKQLTGVAIFRPTRYPSDGRSASRSAPRLLRQPCTSSLVNEKTSRLRLRHIFDTHLLAVLLSRRVYHADLFDPMVRRTMAGRPAASVGLWT